MSKKSPKSDNDSPPDTVDYINSYIAGDVHDHIKRVFFTLAGGRKVRKWDGPEPYPGRDSMSAFELIDWRQHEDKSPVDIIIELALLMGKNEGYAIAQWEFDMERKRERKQNDKKENGNA